MSAKEENAMKFFRSSDPAVGAVNPRNDSPDFARRNQVRMARKLSVGFAVLAAVALPVVSNFVGRGSDKSENQMADVSIDGLKGAAKQSTNQASTPAQTVTFGGAPDLELKASPTELVGADQKFRSSRDGFSFANYAGPPTNDQIDATTMAALFGKAAVCADPAAALCVMLPGAQAVADQLNEAMASGRCEGMSVLAQRYFDGLEPRPGGATATVQISQDSVAKQIGYWWATQVAPSVSANSKQYRAMTPTQITNELINGFRTRAGFTLGLYSTQGGHSVTPIAVTKDGNIQNIYVYDNNYPGDIRKVAVDTVTQSWTYGSAALNSGSAASTWTGSGAGTMDLTAMATRQGPFKVSLGSTKGLKGTSYLVVVTQKDNTTKPVGFKLKSRFGEVNSLDPKSVAKAEFPVKSFLGAGVGQGAIAYIPTVLAEEGGLSLEIVGGEKTGKYTFSVMRTGAAGVVVQSDSKFEISVDNTAMNTKFSVELANSSASAFVQLSSGNSGTELALTNGQSVSVVTLVTDDDAYGSPFNNRGTRRIEDPKSTFTIYGATGKSLVSGQVESRLKNGQAKVVRLSVDSDGNVSKSEREIVGVKADNKFINKIVPSQSSTSFDTTNKKPKAELIDILVPIQLPTRAIAVTTSVPDTIELPSRAIATPTTTAAPAPSSAPAPLSAPPTTTPPTTTPTTVPPVTRTITVDASPKTIYIGDKSQATADYLGGGTETWSVSGNCSINSSTGEITGLSVGNCTVTASVSADGTYLAVSGTTNVSVELRPVSLDVTANPQSIAVRDTSQARASYVSTGTLTWSAGPSDICSISQSGVVTGLSVGTCNITANLSANGNYAAASGSATVTVTRNSNCGVGNGTDPNTPGCPSGGQSETGQTPNTPPSTTTTSSSIPEKGNCGNGNGSEGDANGCDEAGEPGENGECDRTNDSGPTATADCEGDGQGNSQSNDDSQTNTSPTSSLDDETDESELEDDAEDSVLNDADDAADDSSVSATPSNSTSSNSTPTPSTPSTPSTQSNSSTPSNGSSGSTTSTTEPKDKAVKSTSKP